MRMNLRLSGLFCISFLSLKAISTVLHDSTVTLEMINATRHDPHAIKTRSMFGINSFLAAEYEIMERKALTTLLDAMERYIKDNEPITRWIYPRPFEHVIVAFPVHPLLVHMSDGKGAEEKYFIGTDRIRQLGKAYTVYGLGINGQPDFENYMAGLGSSVYGFDCTDHERPEYKFEFHPWCLGQNKKSFDSGGREQTKGAKIFMPLKDIMSKLGHARLDMLKFDIEGFEWELFEDDLLRAAPENLPDQLLFELHTEGSGLDGSSRALVNHKRHHQVNELVYRLWLQGYRCVNIEINAGKSGFLLYSSLPPPPPHPPHPPPSIQYIFLFLNNLSLTISFAVDDFCAEMTFLRLHSARHEHGGVN